MYEEHEERMPTNEERILLLIGEVLNLCKKLQKNQAFIEERITRIESKIHILATKLGVDFKGKTDYQ